MHHAIFSQSPHTLKLDWGWRGCAAAAARGEIVVIVDVLRFSTVCAAACARGISIIPAAMDADLEPLAQRHNAQISAKDFARLSPDSYSKLESGARIVVKSPNGATCSALSSNAPHVILGALANASAVARHLGGLMSRTKRTTTIIACGERWEDENPDGQLRFAIEDYLGAGAILANLALGKSAEAIVCERSFLAVKDRLTDLLLDCASGLELAARGLTRDVQRAASLDLFDVAPELRGNVIHLPPA
jgi:2-phosphosulfolactate phosphatase